MPSYDVNFWPDLVGQEYERHKILRTIRSDWETAGDQRKSMAGNNALYAYALGWRTLTRAQAEALYHGTEFCGGDTLGLFFLEWILGAESNLAIGTGTGSGDITFAIKARLKNDSVADSVLVIKRNGATLTQGTDWTLATTTGNNYREHSATILAVANINGNAYTATWTYARRRRKVRLDGEAEAALKLQERPGGSKLWLASARLIETEAS